MLLSKLNENKLNLNAPFNLIKKNKGKAII